MGIEIMLDVHGNPYLELKANPYRDLGRKHEDQMIELFIRRAKHESIFIKNESSFDASNDYASVRLVPEGTKEGE